MINKRNYLYALKKRRDIINSKIEDLTLSVKDDKLLELQKSLAVKWVEIEERESTIEKIIEEAENKIKKAERKAKDRNIALYGGDLFRVIVLFSTKFNQHSERANGFRINEWRNNGVKHWYKDGYVYSSLNTEAQELYFIFWRRAFRCWSWKRKVHCLYCDKELERRDFVGHHIDYLWDHLCWVINISKASTIRVVIIPLCKKCHTNYYKKDITEASFQKNVSEALRDYFKGMLKLYRGYK